MNIHTSIRKGLPYPSARMWSLPPAGGLEGLLLHLRCRLSAQHLTLTASPKISRRSSSLSSVMWRNRWYLAFAQGPQCLYPHRALKHLSPCMRGAITQEVNSVIFTLSTTVQRWVELMVTSLSKTNPHRCLNSDTRLAWYPGVVVSLFISLLMKYFTLLSIASSFQSPSLPMLATSDHERDASLVYTEESSFLPLYPCTSYLFGGRAVGLPPVPDPCGVIFRQAKCGL